MDLFNKISAGIKFYLKAKNLYQLHSPLMVDFYHSVINDDRQFYAFEIIENLRQNIIDSDNVISTKTPGEPSKYDNSQRLSKIAQRISSPKWKGEFLFRLAKWYGADYQIELGTNLGIGTLYLSFGRSSAQCFTIEGNLELVALATDHFNSLNVKNISIHAGLFDNKLSNILKKANGKTLFYIDGHHAEKPLLSYIDTIHQHCKSINYCICIDDINWSNGMRKAWSSLKYDDRWQYSIDLFHAGILIFDKDQIGHRSESMIRYTYKPKFW